MRFAGRLLLRENLEEARLKFGSESPLKTCPKSVVVVWLRKRCHLSEMLLKKRKGEGVEGRKIAVEMSWHSLDSQFGHY